MDASATGLCLVTKDVGLNPCVNNLHGEFEKSDLKRETYNKAGESAEVISREDADSTSVKGSSIIEELGAAIGGILCIQDAQKGVSGHAPAFCQEKEDISQESKINDTGSLTAKIQKNLSKSATFPSAEKTLVAPDSVDGRTDSSGMGLHAQSSLKSENAVCTRSMSMPASLKLVSAMKGGREQQGTPWMEKMNVKWASDVYDPPATSMSHTVKNHHHRPKSKKKDQKHKHRGKSTRGSSSERKHHTNRRSMGNVDILHLRMQAPGSKVPQADGFDQTGLVEEVTAEHARAGDKSPLSDGFNQSVVVSSVGIGSQEKCGRSFFTGSLAKLHLSVTEAT